MGSGWETLECNSSVMMSELKMLGLTIFLLFFSLSSSLPVKREAQFVDSPQPAVESPTQTQPAEYEYEYEDILDENGNPVYDYEYETKEVPVTAAPIVVPGCPPGFLCGGGVSNGAVNENTGSTGGTKTVTIKKKKKRRRKKKKNACRKTFINQQCYFKCGSRLSRC